MVAQRSSSRGGAFGPVTRVIVVANIRLYREGLAHTLGSQAHIDVLGATDTGAAAVGAVDLVRPDVVVVDTATPDGLSTVRALAGRCPGARIVALGVPEHEPELIACAEAGISGYVNRDGSIDDLIAAIDSVARGEMLCTPRIAAALVRRVATLAGERSTAGTEARLTRREIEIGRLIDEGLSNKEIAQRLCIELPTVKNHVHHLLGKLDVRRRGEAAARLRTRLQGFPGWEKVPPGATADLAQASRVGDEAG